MLIEFSVKNFRSIKERQTLSMVSNSSKELRETNTMPILNGKQSLVRSAAIYGPNASGKTNILKALYEMQTIVRQSARQQRGDELPITPYLFDSETRELPSEFEVIFINEGIRYQYGFEATKERIIEEWLFAYPKGRAQSWIDRQYNSNSGMYEWGNTEKLLGPKQLWQEATRLNALFLPTAIQLNNKQLEPIFDWLVFGITVWGLGEILSNFSMVYSLRNDWKDAILEQLKNTDFSIQDIDIDVQFEEFGKGTRLEELEGDKLDDFAEKFSQWFENGENFKAKTTHLGRHGEKFTLDLKEESNGTQRFFALVGPWLNILNKGQILLIDEINDNLHPLLVKYLVQMFHHNTRNKNNAQLIFTTHETAILSQEIFRRDQIWFTEKDEYNATTLYPLSDFSHHKKVENLEKGYLQGRYGALPYFRQIQEEMVSTDG